MGHEYFAIFTIVKEVAFCVIAVVGFDGFATEHTAAVEMKENFLLLWLQLVKSN